MGTHTHQVDGSSMAFLQSVELTHEIPLHLKVSFVKLIIFM
jgi:hypothetical protein